MTRAALLALASLLPLTSGCIAAAVPLAAGAAMVGGRSVGGHSDRPDGRRPGTARAPRAAPSSVPSSSSASRSDLRVIPTTLTALPPPSPTSAAGTEAIASFGRYSLDHGGPVTQPGRRPSAMLVDASKLLTRRADCGSLPPAVFVDLDPGRATFDPLAAGRADPALPAILARIRQADVAVVWFSRLGENFATSVHAALARSGLDPAGEDRLVLMREISERKQSRRDDIAKELCPIALLGDERADFDELYLYLRNPDAAVALDAMIGRGWFLASPFVSPSLSDAGATP